ncbi:hypothetical protein [Roseovarius sp. D22-M7]|uniref:hypothetical protein n=1 Tax=Roseovarius sp. D22-M7 TaxID=3127116 RepID=UPI00300FE8EA
MEGNPAAGIRLASRKQFHNRERGYLRTIPADCTRDMIAWTHSTTLKAEDMTATLDPALQTSGFDRATVVAKPRLLSDNGKSCIAGDLTHDPQGKGIVMSAARHTTRRPGARASAGTGPCLRRVLLGHDLLPGDPERQIAAFVEYHDPAPSREPRQPASRRRLLRARRADPETA